MNTAAMTPLRQSAFSLLELLPEEQLSAVIGFMERVKGKTQTPQDDDMQERRAAFERLERMGQLTPVRTENSEAFKELMQLCRPIPDLDEKKELAAWREEKFGNARAD